jgi:hypothetical protein
MVIDRLFADDKKAFPVPPKHFPVPSKIFPVRSHREFDKKGQSIRGVRAAHQSQQGPESRKFPVFSLDIRESSAGEWFAGDCVLRHDVASPFGLTSRALAYISESDAIAALELQ